YNRSADEVAKDLLGSLMIRKMKGKLVSGLVVETEAYFDENDPASRAAQNGRTKMTEVMWSGPGTVFVYMVHGHWMLNVVTGENNKPSAVLFRALKPMNGIDFMRGKREKENIKELCSGPGKLTQALDIDKSFNGKNICDSKDLSLIDYGFKDFKIGRSKRIGVSKDLDEPMRFYIDKNKFTSR
ncbi:MAG: DNA-3-methyladenine glycosylase, partial [archaeon]